ncbi:MAG: serine hydrolase [Candidatus Omnitrophota bacterium]
MIGRRLLTLAICAVVLFSNSAFAAKSGKPDAVTARAVYAVDYTNRKVLYAKNKRMKLYPASTVKLLTGLVVLDHKDLQDRVLISARAVNVEPTKAGLTRGATYTVGDLLEALLATSANDAAVALAESVAGSEAGFARLMNKKARDLGMKDSHFVNASGLPDKAQVSSAYDMVILTRAAFSHPFVKKVMAKKQVTITGSDGRKIVRANHNKLLWRLDNPQVLGKTGYTISAGHCYAGIAYYNDRRVSLVILKSRKPWADIYALLGVPKKKAKHK